MGGYAWVTLATNNSYSLGALVLAHSLKKAITAHKLVVLITPAVSQPMREQLQTVFDVVKVVDVLDSKDEAHLALMKRPDLGITFTKIHCWRLVEFEKCVFLDADTLVVRNCDELFEKEEFSAAPDVSWPDCFNSGVFVYRPSVETFNKLLQFAVENRSFDGGDQGLLNQFFSDWATEDIKKHLPFVYNLTSIAAYSYIPAFKHYGSETRIVHFIGSGKPWLQQLDAATRTVTPTSGSEHLAPLLQQWWDLFCEKVHPGLDKNLETNNDGMSHPPVEVRSNFLPIELTDEPETGLLVEPCTPYREKDDFRQHNLPYLPFHVKGPSGELLNVEFLLSSVVPPPEPEVPVDEQERREDEKMEEKFNSSQRENEPREENNVRPNQEGHVCQGCHEIKAPGKEYEVEGEQQHHQQQQLHLQQPNKQQPIEQQHQEQHHRYQDQQEQLQHQQQHHRYQDQQEQLQHRQQHHHCQHQQEQHHQQHHHCQHQQVQQQQLNHLYQIQQEEHHQQHQQQQEESPPPKDPFDYNSFFPDETCISNYLENNIVTYQPFDCHHPKTNGDAETKECSPPLPRFLTIPQNDQRQSGNIEMQPQKVHEQPDSKSLVGTHDYLQREPTPPRELSPPRELIPLRAPHPPGEPTPLREPSPPKDLHAEAVMEKRELSKSKSMSCFPSAATKEVTETSPRRSVWKSQPDLNVDPNKRYSMPRLKPILPKQRSFSKSVPSEIPKITQYTEFLISSEYKDPVGLPKDKIGFVETHIHKVAKLKRSKSDANIRDKFGPLPYVPSPELEKPVIPKRTPQWHFDNEHFDLSQCKRQMGNKPKLKDADDRKEIVHSFPALRPIIPAKDKKSTLIKKRKSKELSPGDGGKEKIAKREPKKARERRRESLITPRNISANGNGNNLDEILQRLREFSKDYQHFFGVVPKPKEKAVTCKNATVQASEQDGGECGSSEAFETFSKSVSTRSRETQTQKRTESMEFRQFRNYIKDQKETSQKGLLGIQDILSESRDGEILKASTAEDYKEENGGTNQSETKDEVASMANHPTQEYSLRQNFHKEIGDLHGISTPVKAAEEQQTESLNPEVNIPIASDGCAPESSLQLLDGTFLSISQQLKEIKINSEDKSTYSEEFHTNFTEKAPPVLLKDPLENSDETPTRRLKLAGDEEIAVTRPSLTAILSLEVSNCVDSKSHKVVQQEEEMEDGFSHGTSGKINEYEGETKEVSESVLQSNYLTSEAQEEHLNPTERQEKDGEDEQTKMKPANHDLVIKTGAADSMVQISSNGEYRGVRHYGEEIITDISSPVTPRIKSHVNGLPKAEGPRESIRKDIEMLQKEENDSKQDSAVRTEGKKVESDSEADKKPEEILCVPDFETPRSSRVTPNAKNAPEMMLTCEGAEKSRLLASQKPPITPGKHHENGYDNGQINEFDAHSNYSPDGTEEFMGKRKPASSPASCTPSCGNAQSECLEELKSTSGIAGAIAQLNLEEGGQHKSDSTAESAAHEEYLRRQNWETGNMDYMGRDSFDNIWTKICQTVEAKEAEQKATGTPQRPISVTNRTESEKKPEDVAASAAAMENPVALSEILQQCPEYIDILPGGEPVAGAVEDDEIIFTKPENRQSCLANITEEEEIGREDSATGTVKLSDILQPGETKISDESSDSAGSGKMKTSAEAEAEKNVKAYVPLEGEAPCVSQAPADVAQQPLSGEDKTPPGPRESQPATDMAQQPLSGEDKTPPGPRESQPATDMAQQPLSGEEKTPPGPRESQPATDMAQQPLSGEDKTPPGPREPQPATDMAQQPLSAEDKAPPGPREPQPATDMAQSLSGEDKTPPGPREPQPATDMAQQPLSGEDKTPPGPLESQLAEDVVQQPLGGEDMVPSGLPQPAIDVELQPEPRKPEYNTPATTPPVPPPPADELQKKNEAKLQQDSDKKAEECTTVAIPSPPVFFPGPPFADKDKTQCKEKPEVKSEPIPLPPPETPVPQDPAIKTSRSDSLKEEGKQKKGVFSKILEMVGVAPKEKNGGEVSKSVFYDVEETAQPKQESQGKQIQEIKETGKPFEGEPVAVAEVKHSGDIAQSAPDAAKAQLEFPEKVQEKKETLPEVKAEELSRLKPDVYTKTVGESESNKDEQQKAPDAGSKEESYETKPGQSPTLEPKGNSTPTYTKQLSDSIQVRKSPSPKLKMPPIVPQTEITVPTPLPQPDVPPRKNSALLKVDDTILETPPVVQPPKEGAEETFKRKLSTEIEDIIGKAKSEVESLLEDQRSTEKDAGESSDLINTMKLMIGGEQPARPLPEEVEELRVTSEEERRRHKGEVVTSKLSDQILRAIPPPRRKAISEASASISGIPKATAAPEQKSPPEESKSKTSKPSSIPVPPPRNRGKPTMPDPSKAKGKK